MASVSVSHLIIFIASIVVAASVVGVFTDSVGQLSSAIDDQGVDVSNDVRTDIEIISDGGSENVYNGTDTNVTIYVKNTGSSRLDHRPGGIDLFVDGQYETNFASALMNDADAWSPGEVVELEIDHTLGSGDHRVKVIVNGDEEVFEFRT